MKRLIGILMLALAVLAGAQEQQTTLNNDAILKMVRGGLGEDVIITAVRTQPGKYSLSPDDLIALKQAGVSEKILTAMLSRAGGVTSPAALPTAPVKIAADTPIRLIMDQALSSSTAKPGDTFKAFTADDLVINGHMVIPKGAATTGKVVAVKHKQGWASFDGMLEVTVDSVPAVTGQKVPLAGHVTVGGGAVSFGRSGHEVQLNQGQIITVHVETETTVAD